MAFVPFPFVTPVPTPAGVPFATPAFFPAPGPTAPVPFPAAAFPFGVPVTGVSAAFLPQPFQVPIPLAAPFAAPVGVPGAVPFPTAWPAPVLTGAPFGGIPRPVFFPRNVGLGIPIPTFD